MTTISRQALFEKAWQVPLTTLAREFGVTSTALKKTCRRHHIPTPSRGYWAQVQAGQVFKRPALSTLSDRRLESIHIAGAAALPEAVKAAQARAKAAPPPPARAAGPAGEGPHPALVATHKALARAKVDADGVLQLKGQGLAGMTLSASLSARAMAWLEQLARRAAARGDALEAVEGGLALRVDGVAIGFHLEEKLDRSPHVPTAKELAKKADRARWGGESRTDPWPKYDHRPSGQLAFVIDGASYSGLRRTFADGKTQTLESLLDEILVAFAGHAAFEAERRRKAEEDQRRAALAEARRQRAEAFNRREGRRKAFVEAIGAQLAERARLQAALAHLTAAGAAPAPLAAMARWLTFRLAEIEARLDPVALELSARSQKIAFDEPGQAATDRWDYYAYTTAKPELHLWAIDDASGDATAQSAIEWACASGHFPAAEGDAVAAEDGRSF